MLVSILTLLLLSGCTTSSGPTLSELPTTGSQTDNRGIDLLLLEAQRTIPPSSTELKIKAAKLSFEQNDLLLTSKILDSIETPYITDITAKEYSFLKAELAVMNDKPQQAISLLDDPRLQKIRLDEESQRRVGRLRAKAYFGARSYLASARELIYVDRLLPPGETLNNHEEIFATLLLLNEATLQNQAQLSITKDIRGWLSLAAMAKKFQHDPLRQLNALRDWQMLWSDHPAATAIPRSLEMLSRIVAEQPTNIALILPLQGDLGKLGEAIRDGFIASHYELTPTTKLNIYDSTSADILELVARAEADGAELIIGPLDRTRVTTLARVPLRLPVIALNRTAEGEINPNLYQFGLAPEDESIQVAQQIYRENRLTGLVIAPDNDWGQRNFDAFTEEFTKRGGLVVDSARFTDQKDYSDLVKDILNIDSSEKRAAELRRITGERFSFTPRRRQDIDFVFLLANPTQAQGINPTLAFFYAEDIPVYATSHIHEPNDSRLGSIDLNGIRFCEMPWKLNHIDPTQLIIEQTWPAPATQLASFYALGVDAHRLYPRIQQLKEFKHEKIFGSTGILSVNEDNVIRRSLMWAQFKDGEVRSVPIVFDPRL